MTSARSRASAARGTGEAGRFVVARRTGVVAPRCFFRLGVADRALVSVGDAVAANDPLIEQVRDASVVKVRGPAAGSLTPGQAIDPATIEAEMRGHGRARPIDRATFLHAFPDGTIRVVISRAMGPFGSPIAGTVEAVDASGVALRADGDGLVAAFCWGSAVRGPLRPAVPSPDAELRAGALDVAASGAVLVAGAKVDIEAITRARALGVRGIVCGGIASRELRQLEASEARQRVSLHPGAPFALAIIDGFGRRPIPGPTWDALVGAAGRDVAIVTDPPLIVLDAGLLRPVATGRVRVTAGADLGREGRLLGLRGQVRTGVGAYRPSALVWLDAGPPRQSPERRVLPLTDLERLD